MNKEDLHRLVDLIPQSRWAEVEKYLKFKTLPEVEASEDENEAIKKGLEEIERGEYHYYENIDDLRKELLDDQV